MSANVWFEEVNIGLLAEIKNTIRVKNPKGVLIPLDEKACVVRKPEEDFKFESFPCVSIYNTNSRFDPIRHNPEPIQVGRDEKTNQIILEDPAVPYNLTYQIDFWARYQTDIDTMTRTWLMKHHRQFNLEVIDDGGVKRSCNAFRVTNLQKSDLLLNKERLFHSFIIYQIWVEIDDETRYNKPMVVERKLDAHEKSGEKEE